MSTNHHLTTMSKLSFPERAIFVCDGKKCGKYSEIRKYCKEAIKANGLKGEVELIKMDCTDRCKQAPIVCFQPGNHWYAEVSERQIPALFEKHAFGE